VTDDERSTTAQGQRRRNLRLALIIAAVALAVYFVWWLKVVL
jgi:ferric-dicitrate binding protein FerR (iron transport regulator)